MGESMYENAMRRPLLHLEITAAVFLFLLFPILVFAASGTIDGVNKYVWGSKIGWINFNPAQGNVLVTDSALTGYVWSQNYGWINLNPTQSGVSNDGKGNLSGYAWGQSTGYINFNGVVINGSGKFTGSANGAIVGVINFDCANCSVITTWQPQSSQSSGSQSGNGASNGNGTPIVVPAKNTVSQVITQGENLLGNIIAQFWFFESITGCAG